MPRKGKSATFIEVLEQVHPDLMNIATRATVTP
jgi:hypothetical protein